MSTTEKSMSDYKHYIYRGQVEGSFSNILDLDWYGETIAPNKKKALSNLMYRFREEHDLYPRTYIYLDPKNLHVEESRTVEKALPDLVKKEEPLCQQLVLPI